ncbi:MAG: DUF3108 domain-containing protein [Gemmatimonadetes bacterium]|nr:DUF3108 domain-containing protein [Gemmatimonadota bacterium]
MLHEPAMSETAMTKVRTRPGGPPYPITMSGSLSRLLFSCFLGGVMSPSLSAQAVVPPRALPVSTPVQSSIARVPFGPGEKAMYEVRLGRLSVGEGSMEVMSLDTIRGHLSYHFSWQIDGGLPLLMVHDHFESWSDVSTLATRRFIQEIDEVRYERLRHYEIYPEEKRWELLTSGDAEAFTTDRPLDDISFIYFVRTLPSLEVGQTYMLPQYFREDRNPVVLNVLRRERIDVPAGTFNTIVVQPILKSGGLFREGGKAEVYFTDDDKRLLIRLTTRGVPLLGDLSLHLTTIEPGVLLLRD